MLAQREPIYQDMASKFFEHFIAIIDAMNSVDDIGNTVCTTILNAKSGFCVFYPFTPGLNGFGMWALGGGGRCIITRCKFGIARINMAVNKYRSVIFFA